MTTEFDIEAKRRAFEELRKLDEILESEILENDH